ncbi:hypothetical protein WA026_019499 [Henosepilachna vigintioctopunctata]|uniref:Uncharacterized protein n=1 Tax=Henosepilachna vigintioctopunctata TaxID=420089 RepID=A0AAW1TWC0_9CUCU
MNYPIRISEKIRGLLFCIMYNQAFLLILLFNTFLFGLCQKHDDIEPVDPFTIKHLQINNYHGPLTAEMLKLFKNVEILENRQCNYTLFEDRVLHVLPNLKKLAISNSNIVREAHDVSKCCRKLKEVEFINSGLSDLPWHQIDKDWPLEKIYLFREKCPKLAANMLVDKKLKHLTLTYSDLEIIEEGAFNGVKHLETLNLKRNKIKTITNKTLAPLKTLKELDLSENLLEEITAAQIPNLPNLEKLNIGHNPIKKSTSKKLGNCCRN